MMFQDQPQKRTTRRWSTIVLFLLAAVFAVVFRGPLLDWFMPGREGTSTAVAHESAALSDEQVTALSAVLESYESVRNALSRDDLASVSAKASEISTGIDAIVGGMERGQVPGHLIHAHAAAEQLRAADDLEKARHAFAQLGSALIPIAAGEERLSRGWVLFACPMVEGFNYWIQHGEAPENPYMGQAMLTCATRSEWTSLAMEFPDSASGEEISHWTCAMHPSVKQSGPGACPICGMDLLPVSKRDAESGVLFVDAARRGRIGVRTGMAEERPFELEIRAVGRTMWDESRLRDITLKLGGWVERLHVAETGQRVHRGQTLFTLYSPELYAAQQELLLALRSQQAARATANPGRADYLVRAAREKLRLWDLSDEQIDEIVSGGAAIERMPIRSPYDGFVIEKNIVEGASVRAGERIYRIGALDEIWIEADVYESDLASLEVGQPVVASLPYVPGRRYEGRISYIYPYLDPSTRTGRIRVVLPNRSLELKPEMYADVNIDIEKGVQLLVPEEAVVQTGPRQIVFVDLGGDRIQPREVQLGAKGKGYYQVIRGLEAGEKVVTSANFLIASESRIRSAEQFWSGSEPGGGHAGH